MHNNTISGYKPSIRKNTSMFNVANIIVGISKNTLLFTVVPIQTKELLLRIILLSLDKAK